MKKKNRFDRKSALRDACRVRNLTVVLSVVFGAVEAGMFLKMLALCCEWESGDMDFWPSMGVLAICIVIILVADVVRDRLFDAKICASARVRQLLVRRDAKAARSA